MVWCRRPQIPLRVPHGRPAAPARPSGAPAPRPSHRWPPPPCSSCSPKVQEGDSGLGIRKGGDKHASRTSCSPRHPDLGDRSAGADGGGREPVRDQSLDGPPWEEEEWSGPAPIWRPASRPPQGWFSPALCGTLLQQRSVTKCYLARVRPRSQKPRNGPMCPFLRRPCPGV